MTTEQSQRGARTIRLVEGYELVPPVVRLLAAGEPVGVDALAAAAGRPASEVLDLLAKQPGVEWDDDGRIVGFGLTLRPTPHRFTFDTTTVYGWCASDTLMFPIILGTEGVVESECAATGGPIRVTLGPHGVRSVEPAEAVVSEVRPQDVVRDVRTEICGLGHFFSSREAAAEWVAAHPEGQVNTVHEDFMVHRAVFEELEWGTGRTE
ncbi:MAG: organomercurial lyase MerB [Actinomycetota bacterium]